MNLPSFVCFSALLFASTEIARADVVDDCSESARVGQVQRDDGKLLDARKSFASCVREECPSQIRKDCGDWMNYIDARTTSIVVRTRSAGGADVLDAQLSLDGVVIALDGKAILVDPGKHVVTAEGTAGRAEIVVLTTEGQKAREVVLTLTTAPAPPPPPPMGQRYASYTLFGVGGAAAIAAGIVAAVGYSRWSALHDCQPNCEKADVNAARGIFVASDVAAGIALVPLGVALVLYLKAPRAPATTFASWLAYGARF